MLVENYHLSVDTPASGELKLVLKSLTITPAEAIAPIQINGESHVTTYLEGENRISINKSDIFIFTCRHQRGEGCKAYD